MRILSFSCSVALLSLALDAGAGVQAWAANTAAPKKIAVATPARIDEKKLYPGWYIKQHMDYHGQTEIFASEAGVKAKTRSLTVYLKPGNQNGVMINDTNRTETVLDKSMWTDSDTMNSSLTRDVDAKILKQFKMPMSPPRIIAGHKCIQHWATAYRHDKSFWFWWEYWIPVDIKLPAESVQKWRTLMHLPAGDSIPLLAIRHFHPHDPIKRKDLDFLVTKQAEKRNFKASEFLPPKGYKKVGDELDMVLGGNGDKDSDELNKLFEDKK